MKIRTYNPTNKFSGIGAKVVQNQNPIRKTSENDCDKVHHIIPSVFLFPFYSLGDLSAFIDELIRFVKIRMKKSHKNQYEKD